MRMVEIRGSFARTTNADPTGDKDENKIYSQRLNAAHQVCGFAANLRTLRGKPRGVLTRVISPKIKKECRLHSSLVLVEIRGSFARTTNADPTGDKDTNKVYSQRL